MISFLQRVLRIVAKLKCVQIKIVNNHFASQSGFVVNNSHIVLTLHFLMFAVCI